jgi:hypothetical protein
MVTARAAQEKSARDHARLGFLSNIGQAGIISPDRLAWS